MHFLLSRLVAGQVMGDNVIFLRPVEKVGTVFDVLESCSHSTFPVVDTNDSNLLVGTISRNVLCALLKQRCFGRPSNSGNNSTASESVLAIYVELGNERFVPITEWEIVEGSYPKYPSVHDIRISAAEKEMFLDLRPYFNAAPITVQETASVDVSVYMLFHGHLS
jgi:CBS domain-containing protein